MGDCTSQQTTSMSTMALVIRKCIVLAIVLTASIFASCQNPTLPMITLKRTSCFGVCPVYEFSVYSDGTIQWHGEQFVAQNGAAQASIDKRELDELVRAFSNANFFGFKNSYRTRDLGNGAFESISDLPTTFLTFRSAKQTKTVEDYAFAPEELRQLELSVERISNTHRWIHDCNDVLTLESEEPNYKFTDAEDLKNEIALSADIARQTKPGFTKLMQAAGQGRIDMLTEELEKGNVNHHDETGWSALMIASAAAKPDAVALLLKSGADVNATDIHGDNALIATAADAIFYTHAEAQLAVLRELLAAGASVDFANQAGETALMWTARTGNPEALRQLITAGANPNRKDPQGHRPDYHIQQWLLVRTNDVRRSQFEKALAVLQTSQK